MAFGDPRTLLDKTGALLPLDRLPDGAALVAGLEIVAGTRGGDGAAYMARFRAADRIRALELLGKHLGLFDDRPEPAEGRVKSFEVTFVRPKPANDADADAEPGA
jgi:phage terminase small subunit